VLGEEGVVHDSFELVAVEAVPKDFFDLVDLAGEVVFTTLC
jgi:hypothetical protein